MFPVLILAGIAMALLIGMVNTKTGAVVPVWKHFTLDELTGSGGHPEIPNVPDLEALANLNGLVVNVLDPLRSSIGKAVNVSSGYRGAALNIAVGGETGSHHTLGRAADIWVSGMTATSLAREIVRLKLPVHELGWYTDGNNTLHVSWWPGRPIEYLQDRKAVGGIP